MSALADELLGTLGAYQELKPLAQYSDIQVIRSLDGQEIGTFRAFAGGAVGKLAIARFVFGAAAEYNYIRVSPPARSRTPQFVYEAMTAGSSTTFSLDLYPAVDLAMAPECFARYRNLLEPIYSRARETASLPWRPSSIAWARVISSPYFFMASTEDEPAVRELASAYLGAWLEFQTPTDAVSSEEEATIRKRRDLAVDGLLAWDPHRDGLVRALGEEGFTRVFDAMLRS